MSFSVDDRRTKLMQWGRIGEKTICRLDPDTFSMSFIVGFSERNFYGIKWDAQQVQHLRYLLCFWSTSIHSNRRLNDSNGSMVIVVDNARIHVSRKTSDYCSKAKIKLITICPFSPSLNPWEKLIGAIKAKIRARRHKNK